MSNEPWSRCETGVIINIRLTPRSARDEIIGPEQLSDGRTVLKARVRAAPEKGEANRALRRLLAEALKVSRSEITLMCGCASRLKTLKIEGNSSLLEGRLAQVIDRVSALASGQTEERQNNTRRA